MMNIAAIIHLVNETVDPAERADYVSATRSSAQPSGLWCRMRSRRISAANRRNSIAGRWRPWLWETTPDDMVANDAPADAPIDGPSREQISLWADDATLGPSGPQLRLE